MARAPRLIVIEPSGVRREVPAQRDRLSELFMSHPSLARRAAAIAKVGRIPAERLERILSDEGVPALATQ